MAFTEIPPVAELTKFLDDADKDVRQKTAQTLAKLGPVAKDAVPRLGKLLRDDLDMPVRQAAAAALAAMGKEAKPALPELIATLDEADVLSGGPVQQALVALTPTSLPEVIKALDTPKRRMPFAAVETLRRLGRRAKVAVPALARIWKENKHDIRGRAGDALVAIGDPAIPALTDLTRDADPQARSQALALLRRLEAPEVAERVVVLFLSDPDPRVRAFAVSELRSIHKTAEAAIPQIVKLLNDDSPFVREQVVNTLAQLGVPAAEQVVALLRSPDANLRLRALEALARFRRAPPSAVAPLAKALQDSDERVRAEAAKALGRYGAFVRDVVPALAAALEDKDRAVRLHAINSLGMVGGKARAWFVPAPPSTVAALAKVLKDSDERVRAEAAKTLGKYVAFVKDVVPVLVAALEDKERAVRLQAINSLGTIGKADTGPVFEALLELAHNKDPDLQPQIAAALFNLGPETHGMLAQELVEGKSVERRRPAARTLLLAASRREPLKREPVGLCCLCCLR